jgi:hypothetical protein
MFKQQITIDVQGETAQALAAAIKDAAAALLSKSPDEAEADQNYYICRGPIGKVGDAPEGYSPNTLYVTGTNDKGAPVIRSFRTSFDAAKDYHIMSSALELSQAVELRGVDFGEHHVGSLVVRPVPKAKPPRDVAQVYDLVHITDLAKLDDEDIPEFISDLPGMIAAMKLARDECSKRGTTLIETMRMLQFVADSSGTVTLQSEAQSTTVAADAVVAGYVREKAAGKIACTGNCQVVRDDDAPRHGCCQACQNVVRLD